MKACMILSKYCCLIPVLPVFWLFFIVIISYNVMYEFNFIQNANRDQLSGYVSFSKNPVDLCFIAVTIKIIFSFRDYLCSTKWPVSCYLFRICNFHFWTVSIAHTFDQEYNYLSLMNQECPVCNLGSVNLWWIYLLHEAEYKSFK